MSFILLVNKKCQFDVLLIVLVEEMCQINVIMLLLENKCQFCSHYRVLVVIMVMEKKC